jgi:threonine dehydrogenase-like Zn-dependent dehydrogenase
MKACVYHGPHDLRVEQVPDPQVADNGIVVKVKACGICGSDLHYYHSGGQFLKPGAIMGHEFSGDVVAVGRSVSGVNVGDRVTAASCLSCGRCVRCKAGQPAFCSQLQMVGFGISGACAEYVAIPDAAPGSTVFTLPDEMSYEKGALMEPFSVGVNAAQRAGLTPGDTVVVFGAGVIGLSAVMALKAMGCGRLIVTDLSHRRLDAARRVGADVVIDAGAEDVPRRIGEETEGMGVDIAVECTGVRRPFLQAMRVLRVDGALVQVGVFSAAFEFNPVTITDKSLRIIGCMGGDCAASMDLLRTGAVNAEDLVTHTFPLERIVEAFDVQSDAQQSIKVMVQP